MNKIKSKRQLTLIELLLAITIMAMVMSMIYGMLLSTLKARDQISAYTQANRLGPTILNLITDDLSAMYFYSFKDSFFTGKRNGDLSSLHFITSIDSKIPESEDGVQSDICEVGYYCIPNPENRDFLNLYRREDFFLDEEPLKGGTGVLLSSEIRSFLIEFYNGSEWIEQWDHTQEKKLPKGIRVELVLKAPSTEVLEEEENIRFTTVIPLPPIELEEKKEEAPQAPK